MDNKNEEGVSLADIFRVGFGRKILLLIITLVVAVSGTLIIKLGYNGAKAQYVASFTYSIPGIDEGAYIDESAFNYKSLVLKSNLEKAKNTDASLKNVDTDRIYEENAISITVENEYSLNNELVTNYTISISGKYFTNEKQAKAFVKALVELPKTITLELADSLSYDKYLAQYNYSVDFDEKISFLDKQYEYLDAMYEKLIVKYGDGALSDGQFLSTKRARLHKDYCANSLPKLLEEAGLITLNESIEALLNERTSNQYQINALREQVNSLLAYSSSADVTAYNEKIVPLLVRNAEIDDEIRKKEKEISLDDVKKEAFGARLDTYYQSVTGWTSEYKEAAKEIYGKNSNVYYNTKLGVQIYGTINTGVAVAFSVVFGLVLGFVVNLVVDKKKLAV